MMEMIDDVSEIMGANLKEPCLKCGKKIKKCKYRKEFPSYLCQDLMTTCTFNYPNQIYFIQFICEDGHSVFKSYLPDEESDQRYKNKYEKMIQRQKEFMNLSYNKKWFTSLS